MSAPTADRKPVQQTHFFRLPHIASLIGNGGMLRGLEKLLYVHIQSAIKKAAKVLPPYNPYLYERLLIDVGKLLDRCLAYRREGWDLESQAVRRALEYQLFTELAAIDVKLIEHATSTAALTAQVSAQNNAAAAFGITEGLAQGFKTLFSEGSTALGSAIAVEGDRKTELNNRLQKLKDHQERLKARHETPGHALNYLERRDRIINLLLPDIVEAYQKARAAQAGLEAQLGITSAPENKFPEIMDTDEDVYFLDKLVLWTRDVMQAYELQSQSDVVFDRTIPLVFPWSHTTDTPPKPITTVPAAVFAAAMKTNKGKLSFSLDKQIPHQFEHLRVRGVGLSIGTSDMVSMRDGVLQYIGWAALLFPPPQPHPVFRSGPEIRRSPIVFGNVGAYQPQGTQEIKSGDEVWNLDPRSGDWDIIVEPLVNYSGHQTVQWPRSAILIDLKLHLKLIARPRINAGDWDFGG